MNGTDLDHAILTLYPEATILEKVLSDGSHVIHPISPTDLAAQLNQIPLATGLLPANTLFWRHSGGQVGIGIYVPPRRWRPIANGRHYHIPLPGLVFFGLGREYTVFAVKQKPTSAEAPLFHLPTPNVNTEGKICLGQAPFPEAHNTTIEAALKLFMEGSEFNHDNSRQRCVSYPDDTLQLWTVLEGEKQFPLRELVAARRQLRQLMS